MHDHQPRTMVCVLVGALLLLTGCRHGVWTGDPADPRVVVLGDSLVYNAEGNNLSVLDSWLLTDQLAADGWHTYVSGRIGATIEFAHDDLWSYPDRAAAGSPDALVLALGTNDMNGESGAPAVPLATARAQLESWLTELDNGTCVRLVGVAENVAGTWRLDLWGPDYNLMLAEVAAEATDLDAAYVAWEPELEWLQEWSAGQTLGVNPHMELAGQAAYRNLIVDAADSCRS